MTMSIGWPKMTLFYIGRGSKHRIVNLEGTFIILEISTGEFDENDIVRVQDDYNRFKLNW